MKETLSSGVSPDSSTSLSVVSYHGHQTPILRLPAPVNPPPARCGCGGGTKAVGSRPSEGGNVRGTQLGGRYDLEDIHTEGLVISLHFSHCTRTETGHAQGERAFNVLPCMTVE